MTFALLPDHAVAQLGSIGGAPDTLELLVRDQDIRRLLLLRAVLDAVDAADADVCPPTSRRRFREDWALLEEAEEAISRIGAEGSEVAALGESPRSALCRPLLGPWARRCLNGLTPSARDADRGRSRHALVNDMSYFSAVAAAVAARAGVAFAVTLTARNGMLFLPGLGALRTENGSAPVGAVHRSRQLRLCRPGVPDVVLSLEDGVVSGSAPSDWIPVRTLPSMKPASPPLPLEDLDPYRAAHGQPECYGLTGPVTLGTVARKRWLKAWSSTATALRISGAQRLNEAVTLLRCLVPLAAPSGSSAHDAKGTCSATRRDAFGAVLSSLPHSGSRLAATLVHELAHAKLAAVSDMLPLHHSDNRARYFAPWRSDPRPYDGLLQGTYAHLTLADHYQRHALQSPEPTQLEENWSHFARCHEQVGAALPALVGSTDLTPQGRRFVGFLVDAHARMGANPAPKKQMVHARDQVRAARRLWVQRLREGMGVSVV